MSAEGNRPVRRALAALGPDYTLILTFFGVAVALGMMYGGHWIWKEGQIYLCTGAMIITVGVRFVRRAPSIIMGRGQARRQFLEASGRTLRDWGPLMLLAVIFENLASYTGLIRKISIDDTLYQMDLAMFGVEPTVWLSKLNIPVLTDWMAFAYGQYLITPLILGIALLARGRRDDFREFTTAVVIQLCLGFMLFVIFPAGPPRFYDPLIHPAAGTIGFDPPVLSSYFGLYEFQQNGFDTVDPLVNRSAFPSVHCSFGLLTMFYGWRFSDAVSKRFPRLYARAAIVLAVSLWISTIYLRHHWLPDCFAGLALGAFACWASPILRRRWPSAENARASLIAAEAAAEAQAS